jgi:flagellum-specific peptidoglycan hydrolase FlgJ
MSIALSTSEVTMGRQPPPDIIHAAQAADTKWHIPASVILAQWALESDWGQKAPRGSNNVFGEKCPVGAAGVTAPTTEDEGGKVVDINARFRAFLSVADAFDFHAEHLATSHWLIAARKCLPDIATFCVALGGGTTQHPSYSTDPEYGSKLMEIIEGSDLTQYDHIGAAA